MELVKIDKVRGAGEKKKWKESNCVHISPKAKQEKYFKG